MYAPVTLVLSIILVFVNSQEHIPLTRGIVDHPILERRIWDDVGLTHPDKFNRFWYPLSQKFDGRAVTEGSNCHCCGSGILGRCNCHCCHDKTDDWTDNDLYNSPYLHRFDTTYSLNRNNILTPYLWYPHRMFYGNRIF